MEIRVLRYFLTVVREESITKASEVLHITQPTLSRQLAQMEEDIGVKLFDRGTRKIKLTNEGILLRRRAEEILQLVDALQPETKRLVIWLVLIHNVFNAAAYPFSGALSNGLRAAGDVKYVSVISTIAVRLLLSWFFGIVLQMGVIGIAIAMVCDWSIRAVIFFWRQKSGKWKTFQVI